MRVVLRLVIALLALLALTLPIFAAEAITAFTSKVDLKTDGSVEATETLAVNAEGDRIRHGIFRDIFTVLLNNDGSKFYSSLRIISVSRDGHPEPYTTEGIANGQRILIGSADTLLDAGPHTYVIDYAMSRMARFFADHDEIYWNATGNYWDFPILKATATLTLPPGARISQLAAYTGPIGSSAHDATMQQTGDNTASFISTKVLQPGDGMTVAAAFQPGVIAAPAGTAQGLDWLSDHREQVVPALAVLIVLLYNLFAWNRVGRDPKRGTIIPLFHPPEGLSPAMAQWVDRMGFKGAGWNALTAAVFDLGVKGLVTIDNAGKRPAVTATGTSPQGPLTGDEQVLFDYFAGKGTVVLDKSNGPTLNTKRSAMLSAISKPNRGVYFNNNLGYVVLGFVIAVLCLGAMVWLEVLDPAWLAIAVLLGAALGIGAGLLRGGLGGSPTGFIFIFVLAGIFGVNIVGAAGGLATASLINTPAIAAGSIVVITVLFAFLMRAPTVAGRRLMDQIEGFRMYLDTAEKNRLNIAGEPPMTVKRFEAILPFAIALGVEKPWSNRFNAALAAGAVADATGAYYSPLWYSGGNFSSDNLSNSISAISTGMSAAMASAVPSSSSSSGFSGGSSGGGGGGGGGGGW